MNDIELYDRLWQMSCQIATLTKQCSELAWLCQHNLQLIKGLQNDTRKSRTSSSKIQFKSKSMARASDNNQLSAT